MTPTPKASVAASEAGRVELTNGQDAAAAMAEVSTTGAKWRSEGKPDLHGNRYDCERAGLMMGNLTDDEMANAVFMYGDAKMSVSDLLAGKPTPTVYLTAAKDRIRWLSRALEGAATRAETAEAERDRLQATLKKILVVADKDSLVDAERLSDIRSVTRSRLAALTPTTGDAS